MDEHAHGPFRVYFLEGHGDCFRRELSTLLATLDERGEIVEHIATHAALTPDRQWQQAAQVVTRTATPVSDSVWRPMIGW
jgi:hypothetical protein